MNNGTTRILLVEDEALIALNEESILTRAGYEVAKVHNGEDAVRRVGNDPPVHLVLMDIDLGRGIDGTEAASRILKERDLPIIFLTSHQEREFVERVKRITRYGYVLKSAGEFVLLEAITMALELFSAHQTARDHLDQLIEHDARQRHLYRVLNSTRTINQLITREKSPQALMDGACRLLVEDNGYAQAWITLIDQGRPKEPFFHAGFGSSFSVMTDYLKSGKIPHCARKALGRGELTVVSDPENSCTGCPLRFMYGRSGASEAVDRSGTRYATMTGPIQADGNAHGWLSVILPVDYVNDPDERMLFTEITHDLAFAVETGEHRERTAAAEVEVAAHELRLTDVTRNTPGMVYQLRLSHDGALSWPYVSPGARTYFGYDPEELMADATILVDAVHPEDREVQTQKMRESARTLTPYQIEHRLYTKSGRLRWVSARSTPRRLPDGSTLWTGIALDVTEAHHAEEARRHSRSHLQEMVKERDVLLKEVNHRVKNNLIIVSSLLSLREAASGVDLSDIKSQVTAIRLLHELLHQDDHVQEISFRTYAAAILESVFQDDRIQVESEIDELFVSARLAVPLGLILNEVATNAAKHAFPGESTGVFSVCFTADPDSSEYVLTMKNDGVAMDPAIDLDHPRSLGLRLVRSLTDQIHGNVELTRRPQTAFTVRFQEPRNR